MGRLLTIELENFKSYAGHQVVGPFKNFHAVIGPNGAGKSNLMDAIAFVLGVKSRNLRSHKLGDLVFRADGKAPAKRRASVKLVYKVDEGEVEDLKAGEELHFMRTIAASGVGSYRINDVEVTWEAYDKRLHQIGVLTKARNFLVFQGDVESVASKSAKELTTFIEQISGSEDFRADYEELKNQKEKAEENTIFSLQKKKGYAAEKKQVREQKEEADRFKDKIEQLADVQVQYFLFQLFHIHKEMSGHQESIEEFEEARGETQAREVKAEASLKTSKKAHAKLNQAFTASEKDVGKVRAELDKMEPPQIKLVAEVKSLQKKIVEDEKAASKIARDQQDLSERIEGIAEDIATLEEAEGELDKTAKEAKSGSKKTDLQMDQGKKEEYDGLKAEAQKKTAADRSQLESLVRQHKSDENSLAQLEGDLADLTAKLEQDKERLKKLEERHKTITAAAGEAKAQGRNVEKELQEVQGKEREDGLKRKELESELEVVQADLRDVKNDRQQSKQEEKMAECLETLKRLFPGVKGRLLDLCKPVQRKYDKAVTVAAGRHMDAIVVDTQQTGYDCIQYMREHRVGVASFIPLQGLKTKEVNERLRSLSANCKLCLDVMSFAPEYKAAVMYAVENTVVCETYDDAREICFRRNEKVKAVSLDGGVISKAGTMTGGNASRDAGGGSRWDGQAAAELKAKRDKILSELGKLDTQSGRRGADHDEASELGTKAAQLKTKEQYMLKDLKVTAEKVAGLRKACEEVKKQASHCALEVKKVQPQLAEREAGISKVQNSIKLKEDSTFSSFSRSIGVASIREFEEGQLKALQEAASGRRDIREQKAKLEAQLQYENTKDFASPLAKITKRVEQTKIKLSMSEERQTSLAKEETLARAKLRTCEEKRNEAKNGLDEKEIEVKALQAERTEGSNERVQLTKKITAEETSVEQLRGKLHTVLQKAKVEEVNLPMVPGEKGQVGNHYGSETASSQQGGSQSHGAGSEATGSTHFSQTQNSAVRKDQADAERVDFAKLVKNRDAEPKHVEKLKKEFEGGIGELRSEIELMQPNMKAAERFEDVSERHKSSADTFDAAREEARDATALFNEVKQKRHDLFMGCFTHVSESLQAIYRDLTKSSKHPLGGNAYLSLDDSEEPYLGGIKYNAMPPMKRFRDMDQLSGGEKTVASLALLFAIHSFRPAPFFVMDEVDAALDNVNVKKVCNYIKQRSRDFQCIVISLKDLFYEQADSLVGICRDVATDSSRTLTLDLEQFDA